MELQSLPPRPGKRFYLKVSGNYRPSRLFMAAAVLSTLGFLWLLMVDAPRGSAAMARTLASAANLGRVGFGLFAVLSVLGFFYSKRSYVLHLEGGVDGGLSSEGGTEGLGTVHRRAEEGPFRVVLLRRLRDDLPASSINPDHRHLMAVAEEDDRADDQLGDYLSAQVALVDGRGERTVLLSVPERLPPNSKAVFEKLRTATDGAVTEIRGGGYQLQLPEGSPGL